MSDASPVEGSTMWMRCNLENGTGPIQYEWHHETRNGNVTVFAQGNSSVINVTQVNRNHTGWYRCAASNPVNRESSNRLWLDTICEYHNIKHKTFRWIMNRTNDDLLQCGNELWVMRSLACV